ncbi:Modification methylase BanI [Pandoraea horticolens]|uniref:Cytosine-specific methyltransferase n=1 Tax=Pandoraea horticolens TaxID=2508298 RepID=A0A5E4SG05_9BURK|nr:DNA (cytosine-5-)-methyltransferase [Pandoraea horticolens]VVD74101.1 Modification methylase BanI [Pandoraea horticolens]
MRQNETILGDCRPLRYLSVCSGIEAATCAWHPLGWQPWAFSEIERFPSAVLAHHYPNVPNLGDMTKFKDWPDATIDLLVGGTPCQSFSVAGLRKGLADPRGNLMLTYLAIARRYAPRWLVWENVPGVLSSNKGRDFGTFLGGLAELGYGFAYRVLDAQYVRVESHARAVPQRRRRVFVVGYLGDWRRPAAVLFERESMLGHPAPRREAGQRVAGTLTRSALDGSGACGGDGRDGLMIPTIARALTTSNQRIDAETETETLLVAHSLRAEGFDASEDGTGRGTPLVPVQPYTLAIRGRDGEHQLEYRQDGTANAVLTPNGGRAGIGVGAIAFDTTQITSPENGSNPQAGGPCHPLSASAHAPAIAFDCKASGRNGFAVGDIAATQRSMGHANSHTNGGGHQAVMHGSAVRRLIPRECERLQGFEDDYTLLPGLKAPDGPRYKALGNSMAVPVMRWIGDRIQSVENLEIETA